MITSVESGGQTQFYLRCSCIQNDYEGAGKKLSCELLHIWLVLLQLCGICVKCICTLFINLSAGNGNQESCQTRK